MRLHDRELAEAAQPHRRLEPHDPLRVGVNMAAVLGLQRSAGNNAVTLWLQIGGANTSTMHMVQRQETSNPEEMEETLEATGAVQRYPTAQGASPIGGLLDEGAARRSANGLDLQRYSGNGIPVTVQRRGGLGVGDLCVRSNVVGGGLTAGHAWLSYSPTGGSETTYGTWGNRTPIGLHRDLEVGRTFAASRCTQLDAADVAALNAFASSNDAWSYTNNCASFAARGWLAVTEEQLGYRTWGIPNPSALGTGIVSAGGTLPVPDAVPVDDKSSSSF